MTEPADVPRDKPIVLFDGVCNLCTGTVRFVIDRDPDSTFRFASLQSPAGQSLLHEAGLDIEAFDSFVLVMDGEVHTKSEGALRVAAELERPWSWLSALLYLPRPLRDGVYDVVARTRYDVFGKKDRCMVPTPELRDRFLDDGAEPAE